MDMLSVFYMLYWNISEKKTRDPSPGDLFYFLFVLSQWSFPADILWALLILSL